MTGIIAVFADYAEPAVMRSRELDPVQNTARFLKVSNVMSAGALRIIPVPSARKGQGSHEQVAPPTQAKQSNPCYGPPRNP
jgi:hypothetical protein